MAWLRAVMSRTRLPRRLAMSCGVSMRISVLTMQRAWLMLLVEPWTRHLEEGVNHREVCEGAGRGGGGPL